MRLTQAEIEKYEQNGYHIYGRLIDEAEVDRLGRIYLDCLNSYEAAHPSQGVRKITHDSEGEGFYQLRCAHLMDPGFDALIREEGLLDAVESLIGPNIRIIICQGLYKPPHSGEEIRWHQDDYYFQVNRANAVVSCWLSFDDATVDSGCMWVIPGGHKTMMAHETVPSGTGFYMPDAEESTGIPIELPRGHCLLHHGLIPHRTLANTSSSHRRALAIHFMDASASPTEARRQEPPENTPIVRGTGG